MREQAEKGKEKERKLKNDKQSILGWVKNGEKRITGIGSSDSCPFRRLLRQAEDTVALFYNPETTGVAV